MKRLFAWAGLIFLGLGVLSPPVRSEGHNRFCRLHKAGGGILNGVYVFALDAEGNLGNGYTRAVTTLKAARNPQPVAVLIDNFESDFRLALKSIRDDFPKGSVILENIALDPLPAIVRLDKRPGQVLVIHDIPLTFNDAKAIHGPGLSKALFESNLNEYRALTRQLAGNKNFTVLDLNTQPGNVAGAVKAKLAALGEDDLVVMIGHNEPKELPTGAKIEGEDLLTKASSLRFHDDSTITSRDLAKLPPTSWIFSCNWAGIPKGNTALSLSKSIDYRTAVEAVETIGVGKRFREMIHHLQNEFKVSDWKKVGENLRDAFKNLLTPVQQRKPEQFLNFRASVQEKNVIEFLPVIATV
jgi:hypothetical protein